MSPSSTKVWFITGCSSGFGSVLTEEILRRGDKVIATARNVNKIESLKNAGADVLQMDVTASLAELKKIAQQAFDIHGRIDYLINNAGYAMCGTLEELTPEETQAQFDTNVFGLLNVTRAFLPFMRAARSGIIGNVSSVGAWFGNASFGTYCASKWCVSGLSESMSSELAEFGIKVCCIEPGYFRSRFLSLESRQTHESRIKDYDGTISRQIDDVIVQTNNHQPGDIVKGAKVMYDVLSGKDGKEVPMRLVLGNDAYGYVKNKCDSTLKLLEEWKDVTTVTDHDDVNKQ